MKLGVGGMRWSRNLYESDRKERQRATLANPKPKLHSNKMSICCVAATRGALAALTSCHPICVVQRAILCAPHPKCAIRCVSSDGFGQPDEIWQPHDLSF